MSPITSQPASRASSTLQCGAGCVSGAPGVRISAAKFFHDTLRRSAVTNPACAAFPERVTTCKPRTAEAEHRDGLARKRRDGSHCYSVVIPGLAQREPG